MEARNNSFAADTLAEVDARGLQCPLPLLQARRAIDSLQSGAQLRVLATDQGSVRDFQLFARQCGHRLLSSIEQDGVYIHLLEKA